MTVSITAWVVRSPSNYNLSNISGVTWSYGKQNILDDYSGWTATLYGFNPGSWTTPQIGEQVGFYLSSGYIAPTVYGYVSNVRVRYGLKPAMDTYEITLEGTFAKAGRIYGSITTTATSTLYMAQSIAALSGGLLYTDNDLSIYGSTTSAQTLTGTVNDLAQLFMRTEGGYIMEDNKMRGRNRAVVANNTFTDVPGDGNFKYEAIDFRSAVDNYSTQVIVQPTGLAQQSAGTGDYQAIVATINGSTVDASTVASFYKTQMDLNQTVPFTIQTSGAVSAAAPGAMRLAYPVATHESVTVQFRGSSYVGQIIGADFDANSTTWSSTFYLTSSLAASFFVLNSTTNGILNTNKLGF